MLYTQKMHYVSYQAATYFKLGKYVNPTQQALEIK